MFKHPACFVKFVSTCSEDHADIQDSNFSYAIFRDSKMHSISFDNVDFTSATFIFAQLTDADVDYSDFNSVYFYYADVRDTSFYYSSFEFVYFVEYSGDGAADIDGLDFLSCTFSNLVWVDNNNYNTDPT